MKEKLNNILLIDDDPVTNLVNKRIIGKIGCAEKVTEVLSGEAALDYLKTPNSDGVFPRPNLIFLDINMPGMDGWEFLEHYKALPEDQRGGILLMMLTSSLSIDDKTKAKEHGIVNGFKHKPLTVDMLSATIQDLFPNKF